MSSQVARVEPIIAQEQERPAIRLLEQALAPAAPKLVGSDGHEIPIPESAYRAFRQLIHVLASGQAAYLVPMYRELTTQEAAELLNVSRPFVTKLLKERAIPYVQVGSHRRIRMADLLAYQHRRDSQRREALDELSRLAQDEGLHGDEV
jgi:excisionase family DNA binding protein